MPLSQTLDKHLAFNELVGNEQVKEFLAHALEQNRLGNSLLFAGPEGVGKSLFAKALAKVVLESNQTHPPDLHEYFPEGKLGMHSIDAMRDFSRTVYLAPFTSKKKVFIIHDAERMLPTSANALLKTFEEPALDSLIILISSEPSLILPTILSRCRVLRFQPITHRQVKDLLIEHHKFDENQAVAAASLCKGSIGQALRLVQLEGDAARRFLYQQLACGRFAHYSELMTFAKDMAAYVERAREKEEEIVRQQMQEHSEHLSAIQKEALEKEIEGLVAMQMARYTRALLEAIVLWYRDLQALNACANDWILNRDVIDLLETAFQKGGLIPLEKVQKIISDGLLSLQRSTSFQNVLENILLRLQLI